MKGYLILLSCLAGLAISCTKTPKKEDAEEHDIAVYHQAMRVGDFTTAIAAIHSALAAEKDGKYYDTLAILYFRNNQYPQAALSAQELLTFEPKNVKMLNIAARSYEMLDLQDSALIYFKRLQAIDMNPEYEYQVAMTQYKLNNLPESEKSAKSVIADPRADTMQMIISSNSDERVVPLRAAAYNLLGTISHTVKNDAEAKQYFEEALKLDSGFTLVRNNLEKVRNIKNKK